MRGIDRKACFVFILFRAVGALFGGAVYKLNIFCVFVCRDMSGDFIPQAAATCPLDQYQGTRPLVCIHAPIPSPHTPRLVPHAMPSHTRRVEQAVAFYPSQCAPLVLVLGLEEYLSKHGGGGGGGRHAQGDKRVLHDMVTDSLAEMLVALGVAWRAVECEDEVVQVILRMARAIAQEPYRDPISVVHLYRDSKASAGRSNSLRYHLLSLFLACCLAPSLPMTACQEASCALRRCCAMRTVCKWG